MLKKILFVVSFVLSFSVMSVAHAWMGYIPQDENFVYIGKGNAVKPGNTIVVKHAADQQMYKVKVESVNEQSNIVEVNVYNLDKQKKEYYRMHKYQR